LAKAERQAAQRSLKLPERFAYAQSRRAKVTDISGGETRAVTWDVEPATLLEQTIDEIEKAVFVGNADRDFVQYLLADFEWVTRSAMLLATHEAQSESASVEASMWQLRHSWASLLYRWSPSGASRTVSQCRRSGTAPLIGQHSMSSLETVSQQQ
jgi:hypothetical protein